MTDNTSGFAMDEDEDEDKIMNPGTQSQDMSTDNYDEQLAWRTTTELKKEGGLKYGKS